MDILKKIDQEINAGNLDKAEKLCEKSNLTPSMRSAVSATIALRKKDFETAEVLFDRSIKYDPNNIIAIGNYGVLLITQKKYKKALEYIEKAYNRLPANESYATNYAACLTELDRYEEAIKVAEPFVEKDGKPNIKMMISICSMYRAILKPEIALEWLVRIKAIAPENDPEVERAEADIYAELDPAQASIAFEKASHTTTNITALSWNWSFVELRLQNFEKAWQLYENGLSDKIGKIGRPLPNCIKRIPLITRFEDIDPKKYTVFTVEQGIGDQVLFMGCFNQVIIKYPKSILICERRMRPIFARAFPDIEIFEYGLPLVIEKQSQKLNGVFPIGSLQKYFRNSVAEYEAHRYPYLKANEQLVQKYRSALEKASDGKIMIGISWIGGFWDRQKKTKSFDFEIFSEILNDDRYMFVSLQYGDITNEKKFVKENNLPVKFVDGINFKTDLDAWMSLACACDRIISVSTALVHFAGATGKRVDLLLADRQSPFIWGTGEGRSLPYKETYIHRKKKEETHQEFLQRVKDELL